MDSVLVECERAGFIQWGDRENVIVEPATLDFVEKQRGAVFSSGNASDVVEGEMRRTLDDRDTRALSDLESVAPIAEYVADRERDDRRAINLLDCAGRQHRFHGRFAASFRVRAKGLPRVLAGCLPRDPQFAISISNLGRSCVDAGIPERGLLLAALGLAVEKKFRPDNGSVLSIRYDAFARALLYWGYPKTALAVARDAMTLALQVQGPGRRLGIGKRHFTLGAIQAILQEPHAALANLAAAGRLLAAELPEDHHWFAAVAMWRGEAMRQMRRLDQSYTLLSWSLEKAKRTYRPDHPVIATHEHFLNRWRHDARATIR
ncbi:MAG: hypothetical protein U0Q16_03965 [Bryobacteraceae bacterium]